MSKKLDKSNGSLVFINEKILQEINKKKNLTKKYFFLIWYASMLILSFSVFV